MKPAAWLPAFAFLAAPFAAMAEEAAPQEVPAALAGLSFVRQETVQWYVVFGLESDGWWAPKLVSRGLTKRVQPMVTAAKMIKPGDIFFEKDEMKGRFKFLGFADKEVKNPVSGVAERRRVAEFEDLKHNKKGFKYESIKGLPENEIASHAYYDRIAVLGIKVAGKDWPVEFKVDERANFALPPDGTNKDFFLKEVSGEKVVVEYKDQTGAVHSVTLPKHADKPAAVYKSLVSSKDAAALAVIEQLGNIKLTPKGVDKQSLAEAIRSLSDAGAKHGKATGVINYVIRDTPDKALKVSLPEQETNFAAAVDEACRQARYRWRIEIAEDSKRALLVLASPYHAMVRPQTAEQLAVLDQLENVKLTPKGVKDLELGDALFQLNKQGAEDKATGVINSVTRGSDDHTKITLPEEETNFAAALDLACWQAGFRWTIEAGMDKTQPPLLVLYHKDEKQSGKQGGGGDAALENEETPQRDDSSEPSEDPFGPGD